ncbi:ABC transporter ATP-binding protein [Paracoccus suum]|uniref:ABC transporter ATP-binding protein n=1 Tax=Paracoccus suum TaxID=2259340 RepID=A0A344PMA6_9RHOB|nr:ABC transporter ATP-binding protein [Paracoccus suum]AXC50511.1 ABC transporter ATP-binding protein [Paracoccus suum]
MPELLGKAVTIRSLVKSYGAARVLHGLDLDIGSGEFCTLLGASGSGKTTTLKAIAGFEQIDSGSISIDGVDIAPIPVARRNIGMVFQNYALFPHMSVRRNVAFGLEMRRLASAEIYRRVDDVLKLVELTPYADKSPEALSGGQQQRVALARALVINPDILLMDEPLGALDKNLRQAIQLQLKALHRELGVTIIYVTHDQEEALHLSDRIVIMDQGRIVQHGTPHELYFNPDNPFVAGFLGECNFLVDSAGKRIGVRPEVMRPGASTKASQREIAATIESVIFLGSGTKIVGRVGDTQITAVVNNGRVSTLPGEGEVMLFHVDEGDVMIWPSAAQRG